MDEDMHEQEYWLEALKLLTRRVSFPCRFNSGRRFVTSPRADFHLIPLVQSHLTLPSLRLFLLLEHGTMSLSSILGNTQTPHQPLLVIADTPTLPGHAVLKDLVRRNLES